MEKSVRREKELTPRYEVSIHVWLLSPALSPTCLARFLTVFRAWSINQGLEHKKAVEMIHVRAARRHKAPLFEAQGFLAAMSSISTSAPGDGSAAT